MSDPSVTREWVPREAMEPGPPPTIPGFEILEELGRGGMGVVYKARQSASQRLVALKVIRDGALASPHERARFGFEAEAVARMRHPNIVEVLEVGEHEGRPYFAMELVEGGTLDVRLGGQPQPPAQAAELVMALALAVEHAHAQKVVHRDLKPANVLLSVDETQGAAGEWPSQAVPKIADFGLAKRMDAESAAWTQAGAVIGTAQYMAPEQAAGNAGEIGPAVDVYALGAILYELLTGQPPFVAETWGQTVEQVLHDEPTPPTRLRSGVPRDLETVCLKCLEKTPARRYGSAQELVDDLGRFLAGQAVAAIPIDAQERLSRLAARDGYRIVEEIGRGPRSTVYRALYEPANRHVALKVFSADCCAREAWDERMRRSGETWAGLAHPHIVPIQRAGWLDDAPYVAIEYAPQGSLADNLANRPYSIAQALRLMEQLTDVVNYLHRQGVVHGNLKPSNVLLAADGIPRVVDLSATGGLFQDSLSAEDASSAGVGYLAPELVGEEPAEPRPNTDVYGLGLVLYELLAGRPAFSASTASEMLEQVRNEAPIAPSNFNPYVSADLDKLCLRCLNKNPWQRFTRVYTLTQRLRCFQETANGPSAARERRPK